MKHALLTALGGTALLLLLAYVVAGVVVLVQTTCQAARAGR
jgi:hypothetical protein